MSSDQLHIPHAVEAPSRTSESGQAVIGVVVIFAVLVLAGLAFAVDFANLRSHRQAAQSAADAACQAGAVQVDGALCALGAGAGNAPTEVLAATFSRLGIATGVDVDGVLAAAEEVVRPIIPRLPWMDRSSVVQGYAGVYSSFLLHAQRAAERYGVPAHAILQRVGEAGYVGGQEDMIIDIALQLQAEREQQAAGNRQGAQ